MSTIDQQFVEYIVKTLVNNPDKVSVDRKIDEKGVLLSLSVDPEDVGRVIGKRGATAQSIRTLLRALGTKNDARYNLKIVNTDGEGAPESSRFERGRNFRNRQGRNRYGGNLRSRRKNSRRDGRSRRPRDLTLVYSNHKNIPARSRDI